MTEKEYLIEKVNEIGMQFTDLAIRYAYDSETNFHIIEVVPGAIKQNMDFAQWEALLYQEFYALYHEDLLITEPSVLTKSIDTIIYKYRTEEIPHEEIIAIEPNLPLSIKKFDVLEPDTTDYSLAA